MKIRCVTNSIRLRVRKSELATLLATGQVVESVAFGPRTLTYRLAFEPGLAVLRATFVGDCIEVLLPQEEMARWATTDQVGIEQALALPTGEQLQVLVEKDFPCQDRAEEDRNDTFEELVPSQTSTC
jgi:hypothetical protein